MGKRIKTLFIQFVQYVYAVYAILKVHKVHKKRAYRMQKSLFFLRPFYVLSTSFLRNGYMEVQKLHTLYIFCIYVAYFLRSCIFGWESNNSVSHIAPFSDFMYLCGRI